MVRFSIVLSLMPSLHQFIFVSSYRLALKLVILPLQLNPISFIFIFLFCIFTEQDLHKRHKFSPEFKKNSLSCATKLSTLAYLVNLSPVGKTWCSNDQE